MGLFSKNLRFLRKQRRLNQDEIARLFGKRANTVGNWENGKSEPNLKELARLGEYFEVSLQDLLHADLETGNRPVPSTVAGLPEGKSTENITPVGIADGEGDYPLESVLRELRTINGKLDKITSALQVAGVRNPADKSNH